MSVKCFVNDKNRVFQKYGLVLNGMESNPIMKSFIFLPLQLLKEYHIMLFMLEIQPFNPEADV